MRNSINLLGFMNSVTMNNKACAMFVVTKRRAGLVLSRSRVNERSSDHTQVPPINHVVVVCV